MTFDANGPTNQRPNSITTLTNKAFIMSGSELAPFVAAALRDKVFLELQKENSQLQAAAANWAATPKITITSPQDSNIVYAMASLANRKVHSGGAGDVYQMIDLANNNGLGEQQMCQVGEIENAVIRIGDEIVGTIGSYENVGCISDEGDEYMQLLYTIRLPDDHELGQELHLLVEYGPRPENVPVEQWDEVSDPNEWQNHDIAQVCFKDVEFHNKRAFEFFNQRE